MTTIEKLKTKGRMPRAALYARFSSDNQREESIDAQLRAMHDFCKNNGITVVDKFCDKAKSALTDNRPEFLNMITAAREGRFDVVIVHKLDRFSRDRYDSAFYKRELRKNGVNLISVLEHLDDSPESIILESVLEGMSEYYSKNLSREVMKGLMESARQCRYLGGNIPYGYKVNYDTYKFEVNDVEAEAVKIMFNSVAEGMGYADIVDELNLHGYRTKTGRQFVKNSISDILRNEKYRGIYIFNRATSKNVVGTRNNHLSKSYDEMIRIEGGMPRIIDDDTFFRVSKILKSRSNRTTNRTAKETYLLSGKIICGKCGSAFTGNCCYTGRNKLKAEKSELDSHIDEAEQSIAHKKVDIEQVKKAYFKAQKMFLLRRMSRRQWHETTTHLDCRKNASLFARGCTTDLTEALFCWVFNFCIN